MIWFEVTSSVPFSGNVQQFKSTTGLIATGPTGPAMTVAKSGLYSVTVTSNPSRLALAEGVDTIPANRTMASALLKRVIDSPQLSRPPAPQHTQPPPRLICTIWRSRSQCQMGQASPSAATRRAMTDSPCIVSRGPRNPATATQPQHSNRRRSSNLGAKNQAFGLQKQDAHGPFAQCWADGNRDTSQLRNRHPHPRPSAPRNIFSRTQRLGNGLRRGRDRCCDRCRCDQPEQCRRGGPRGSSTDGLEHNLSRDKRGLREKLAEQR